MYIYLLHACINNLILIYIAQQELSIHFAGIRHRIQYSYGCSIQEIGSNARQFSLIIYHLSPSSRESVAVFLYTSQHSVTLFQPAKPAGKHPTPEKHRPLNTCNQTESPVCPPKQQSMLESLLDGAFCSVADNFPRTSRHPRTFQTRELLGASSFASFSARRQVHGATGKSFQRDPLPLSTPFAAAFFFACFSFESRRMLTTSTPCRGCIRNRL